MFVISNYAKELTTSLKRTANTIFEKGGVIRKIENLGTRDMPHKQSAHGVVYKQASYFMIEFNAPPKDLADIDEQYSRDIDIIRRRIYKKQKEESIECTLHEEMLPPLYRKSVQELVQQARKLDKPKFKYNSGLDYYPFQK
ncbi:small ribosomal subunit protein bS6m isoform X2 [Onthophagus taurus]|uniref:small ribosomal subunit protein bS6m isoform X2 n=1 Tax=Onthophagus taurus TaxID=166361 RepID=UPI000C200D01|nr:probable 28S ribosomal protein S6, mitochondrial isoform X2 [Onthophagus taurus]